VFHRTEARGFSASRVIGRDDRQPLGASGNFANDLHELLQEAEFVIEQVAEGQNQNCVRESYPTAQLNFDSGLYVLAKVTGEPLRRSFQSGGLPELRRPKPRWLRRSTVGRCFAAVLRRIEVTI
jgi:hypothetical protein